jgi:hypothetical protein
VPNRILREGILTSQRIAKLGWAEEVFYRRMHSIVDDFGRYFADVGLLRAACYPRQLNKVSDSDVGKWLHACEAAALVRVYQVDGEDYLLLLDFNQQVRAKKSKFPDVPIGCVADAQQTPANAHLDVSVSVSVSEDVSRASAAPAPQKGKNRKTGLPEDFAVSERVTAWAAEKGYGQLQEHLEAFKRKAAANGYSYADWDAAFMEAIREDWAKLRGKAAGGAAPAGESKTVPLNPRDLYKPEPKLTPEQIAVNRANAARSLEALKQKGIAGLRSAA